jgi:HK97 family phage major capsid protein
VVTWLKGEMRLMLDEELARAILVGDGRAVDDEDKINEDNIRPVASDNEVYTTTVNVNIGNANSSAQEIVDAIVSNRRYLRGSGTPTMYTKESVISTFLLLKDTLGRRIYRTLDEVASELRVDRIVPVEVLEEHDDVLAIIFNPSDYVVGADKGGNVSMFDDFDIDYNQHKYLIETRVSGALVKLKAALVVRSTDAASVETVPAEPAFDGEAITITDQAGVVYRNAETDAVMNAAGSPYAVADGETVTVNAEPAAGYHFPSSENDSWNFTGTV